VARDESQNRGESQLRFTRLKSHDNVARDAAIKRGKRAAGGTGRRIGDRKLRSASARTAPRPKRRVGRTRYGTDGGGRESRAEERQRQNATNSKRAEPCACIRNAIGPLSTGAGPLLSTGVVAGGRVRRGGGGGGGGGRALGALGAAGRRKILIAPISIFGRSFACSLFGKPTKIPPAYSRPAQTDFLQHCPLCLPVREARDAREKRRVRATEGRGESVDYYSSRADRFTVG